LTFLEREEEASHSIYFDFFSFGDINLRLVIEGEEEGGCRRGFILLSSC
jgi:hypothetical protein